MESKICTKCNIGKNISEFGKLNRKLKNGNIKPAYKSRCKICETIQQKIRREKEKKDDPNKYHKKWADYYAKTKEHNKQAKKNWINNSDNRAKRNEYIRNYKKNRRNTDPSFVIYENTRKRIWKCIDKKSNSSKELLGCDIKLYLKWIEFTMKPEMNWKNYGIYWNIDHVLPISTFDLKNSDEIKKAFNWKNTIAMIASDNFSKCNKINNVQIEEHKIILNHFISNNIKEFEVDNPQRNISEIEIDVQRLGKVA